jgi:integrase
MEALQQEGIHMEIRRLKSGLRYREMLYVDGKVIKSPSFKTKRDAKSWKATKLAEREHQKLHGIQSTQSSAKTLVNEFAKEWLENRVSVKNTARTLEIYTGILNNHILPIIGHMKLRAVSDQDLQAICLRLKKRGNNGKGINNVLGVLRTMYKDAINQKLLALSPFATFKNLPVEPVDYSFWSKPEMTKFLSANQTDEYFEFYLVALYTGLRRGELVGLCWDRVDFVSNVLTISRTRDIKGLRDSTKTKLIRYIPIHPRVKDILVRLMREQRHSQYVFTNAKGVPVKVHHLYRYFKRAQERAGLSKRIRVHDLRHTFASQFMMNGGNIFDLQKVLGHTDIKMTQRYAHHSPEHLQSSIQYFGFGEDIEQTENVLTLI